MKRASEAGFVKVEVLCECRCERTSLSAGTMFESPIDFYKSQWQSQIIKAKQTPGYVPPYKSVGECVAASIKFNGVKGPFQGLGATMTRNLPAGGVAHSHSGTSIHARFSFNLRLDGGKIRASYSLRTIHQTSEGLIVV